MSTAEADIQNKIRKGKMTSEKENLEGYLEIADEKASAEQIKLSSEEDLESLIKLAEDLREKIDNIFNRIVKIRFLQFIFIISFLIYLFGFFYLTKETITTERENLRKDDIKTQQQMLTLMSSKRDDLIRDLKYASNGTVSDAINKRIEDVERSIRSTESNISNLMNEHVKELSFIEFLSMPDKIVPGLIFLFMALFVSAYFMSKYKKTISPEKTSLSEILQLLREVHGTIAEREDWSILKRAEFRIRLSRFDLSEKKDSVFNFFS